MGPTRDSHADPGLVEPFEKLGAGRVVHYPEGKVLYWQGDPVGQVFVVKEGAVKVSAISAAGQVRTYSIVGKNALLGANSYLLGSEHEFVAEAFEDSELLVLETEEFEQAMKASPEVTSAVMRNVARGARRLSEEVSEMTFLSVQERLKRSLIRLAEEHGLHTPEGIKIDIRITHEEIGALVAANRSTITECLGELRKMGYIWTEGRRFVIVPPEHMQILDKLTALVYDGDDTGAESQATKAVTQGVDPLKAIEALTFAMREVDRAYSQGELDLPDVVLAAYAMQAALAILEDNIVKARQALNTIGTVVIGTVCGDIHDIGKTIVAMLMRARGFHVIDLGVNVEPGEFVHALREYEPDIVALSALTTATSLEIGRTIKAISEADLRDKVKVMVGGGAVTQQQADRFGADGHHATARGAVELAWGFCTRE